MARDICDPCSPMQTTVGGSDRPSSSCIFTYTQLLQCQPRSPAASISSTVTSGPRPEGPAGPPALRVKTGARGSGAGCPGTAPACARAAPDPDPLSLAGGAGADPRMPSVARAGAGGVARVRGGCGRPEEWPEPGPGSLRGGAVLLGPPAGCVRWPCARDSCPVAPEAPLDRPEPDSAAWCGGGGRHRVSAGPPGATARPDEAVSCRGRDSRTWFTEITTRCIFMQRPFVTWGCALAEGSAALETAFDGRAATEAAKASCVRDAGMLS